VSKRIVLGIIVLIVIAGGGLLWRNATAKAPKLRIGTTTPSRGEFVVSLSSEGTLQSDDAVAVRTGKAPGQITMIVSDGTILKTGDVFCKIESRELQRQQTDAELAAKQAQEEIDKSRESAEEDADNADRALRQAEKDFSDWNKSTSIRTNQAQTQLDFDRGEENRLRIEYDRIRRMAEKGYAAGSEAELAKAAYEAQQFKVQQSVKELELSYREIESEKLQKENAIKAARQRAVISRSRIKERVAHAKSHAEETMKKLQTVLESLKDSTIVAPADGTVSLGTTYQGGERRSWREGDQVMTGAQLGTISGTKNMSIRCRIKESDIASLKKDEEAEIDFDALTGRVFSGAVSTVGAVAREVWVWEDPSAEANERVFDVLVKLKSTKVGGLKPGLNARVRIIIKRIPNQIFIPLDSVVERDGKSYVYVKNGNGFKANEVKTGDRNDVAVIIKSGISAGDVIALSDPTKHK
jgi:HlyD family secretion protein